MAQGTEASNMGVPTERTKKAKHQAFRRIHLLFLLQTLDPLALEAKRLEECRGDEDVTAGDSSLPATDDTTGTRRRSILKSASSLSASFLADDIMKSLEQEEEEAKTLAQTASR